MIVKTGRFGAMDGAALIVSSVVGAGIFTVPSYVASIAGTPALTIALWFAGGLLALAGALCYAELATRFPRGGAEYVYLREAFGETAGFLSGWTSFIAGFSGAIAAAAVGFAAHVTGVMPAFARSAEWTLSIGPLTLPLSATTAIALALIALFTMISIAGVSASRLATNGLALVIVVGLAVLAFVGFFGAPGRVAAPVSAKSAMAFSALVPIFFTYSGWNAAAYVAGEFRDPQKNIPRALILGTLIVTLLYVALNVVLIRVLSPAGLAAASTPVATAARALVGNAGGALTMVLVLAAMASSVCALIITGPRIYREMARDGVLPSMFAGSAKKDGPPASAAIAQSIWSGVLVLTGTFQQIVTYTGFAILLFSGAAVMAVFILRRRYGAPKGFAVPGYPLVPLAFVASVALIAVLSFRYAPGPSILGVVLIAAGLPLLMLTRQRASSSQVVEAMTENA
ncbi:MAG: amino acid permease [Gemmatimonadota bacterium]|nr:amino acid permease [Gemmatimonadota bacterium]